MEQLKQFKAFLFTDPRSATPKQPWYLDGNGVQRTKGYTQNQMTYEDAAAAAERTGGHVGIYLREDMRLCCVDIDGLDAESPDMPRWEQEAIRDLLQGVLDHFVGKTYIDRSLSGKGRHAWFFEEHPGPQTVIPLDEENHRGIEIYTAGRFIVLGTPENDLSIATLDGAAVREYARNKARDLNIKAITSVARRSPVVPIDCDSLDALAQQANDALAKAELAVTDEEHAPDGNTHTRWKFETCPNCGEADRPMLGLLNNGQFYYSCFHANRCGAFRLREFLGAVGLDPEAMPWDHSAVLLVEAEEEGSIAKQFENPSTMATEPPPSPPPEVQEKIDEREAKLLEQLKARYKVEDADKFWANYSHLKDEYFLQYADENGEFPPGEPRGIFIAEQPMIIGGPSKTLKTSFLMHMAQAIATGQSFGPFVAPEKRRVLVLSGESGKKVLARMIGQQYRFAKLEWSAHRRAYIESGGATRDPGERPRGRDLGENLKICTEIPNITSKAGMAALDKYLLPTFKPAVLVLDPAYFLLGKDDIASNMFAMGQYLNDLTSACGRHGTTVAILHHTTKTTSGATSRSLNDLAFAAWNQFAGQWILLSRQEAFKDGVHRVRMETGNRNGDSEDWGIQVIEREYEGEAVFRTWRPSWVPWAEAKAKWAKQITEEEIKAEHIALVEFAGLCQDAGFFPSPFTGAQLADAIREYSEPWGYGSLMTLVDSPRKAERFPGKLKEVPGIKCQNPGAAGVLHKFETQSVRG